MRKPDSACKSLDSRNLRWADVGTASLHAAASSEPRRNHAANLGCSASQDSSDDHMEAHGRIWPCAILVVPFAYRYLSYLLHTRVPPKAASGNSSLSFPEAA